MSVMAHKRIMKELAEFTKNYNDNDSPFHLKSSINDLDEILIDIKITNNSLYDPTIPYTLSYKISDEYPFQPPIIVFVGNQIPIHPHIYSNGHICLNILYDGWTPAQNLSSIILSLQSMIHSNTTLERPKDDKAHSERASSNPQKTNWIFHDDTV